MRRTPIIVAVAVILGWWGISMTRSLSSEDGSFRVPVADGEEGITTALREPAAAEVKPKMMTVEVPDPKMGPAAMEKPVVFEFQNELNSYAMLKTKVLPSADEKLQRESLLKNAALLRSLGQRLVKQPLMSLGEQDVALDLLVEALTKGDHGEAAAAIGAIVADAQLEDPKLSMPVREQLAGIKAELLFHWTAYEPKQAGQVAGMLPGPASKKIWDNVQEAQRNNLAASAEESR